MKDIIKKVPLNKLCAARRGQYNCAKSRLSNSFRPFTSTGDNPANTIVFLLYKSQETQLTLHGLEDESKRSDKQDCVEQVPPAGAEGKVVSGSP